MLNRENHYKKRTLSCLTNSNHRACDKAVLLITFSGLADISILLDD